MKRSKCSNVCKSLKIVQNWSTLNMKKRSTFTNTIIKLCTTTLRSYKCCKWLFLHISLKGQVTLSVGRSRVGISNHSSHIPWVVANTTSGCLYCICSMFVRIKQLKSSFLKEERSKHVWTFAMFAPEGKYSNKRIIQGVH